MGAGERVAILSGTLERGEMNLKEIKELIEFIARTDVSELEIERSGSRLKIRRGLAEAPVVYAASQPRAAVATPHAAPPAPERAAPLEAADASLHTVKSPIVGTFYRAPSPDADPFVKPGDAIEKGTVLCIIEAMKLMNEIESEVAGEIVQIFVESGHPVEFGEPLFSVRLRP